MVKQEHNSVLKYDPIISITNYLLIQIDLHVIAFLILEVRPQLQQEFLTICRATLDFYRQKRKVAQMELF